VPALSDGATRAAVCRQLLADLVRIDSTSGEEGEARALTFVATWLSENCPGQVRLNYALDGSPTALVIHPALNDGRPLLLFSAHIDTVPVGDISTWPHNPFEAVTVGDRMFGRGTSDMKSGLAAAMVAVAELLHDGAAVALAVSTGEEVGCLGATDVAELLSGIPVAAIIVPESTLNEVVLGHRGALWLTVSTAGVAAHGSTPERGKNAIADAVTLLGRLHELPLLEHTHLGRESVNVGTIHAGTVPNIVPDHCELQIDVRVVNADSRRLVDWLQAQPEVANVAVTLDLAAVWTDPGDAWVHGLGAPIAEAPASYFTDASVLTAALPAEIPVVVWGPGDPALVHTTRESVSLSALDAALDNYRRIGRRTAQTGPDLQAASA
jgi:succinyl-diaminopimelate desuccinylase